MKKSFWGYSDDFGTDRFVFIGLVRNRRESLKLRLNKPFSQCEIYCNVFGINRMV